MKVNKTISKIILLLGIFLTSISVKAADCGDIADIFVSGFNQMTAKVVACQTMEDFEALNFEKIMNNLLSDELAEKCAYEKITFKDKEKMIAAWNLFVDSMTDKTYEMVDGLIPKDTIAVQLEPMKTKFNNVILDSDTWVDLAQNMEELEM